ncbi:hypothetical protein SI65_01375 [Aspergillus cristatus]|uniref:Uncharacterized protein n=1 Tax=Aspergillus cristatus TaxID=573508 RepID=A0A1E3BTV4_ASPCR|nr:hypothetical protein SI65_01375 [Aspergillus cristatus]
MHLVKPLASFLAASAFTNASMSSNLPKPLSEFLAAGNSAFEKGVGEAHKLAAAYGPPMLEKLEEATRNVRDGAAAYGPPVWEKAEKATQWSAENPVEAACVVVGTGGALAVAAPAIVSAPILSSAGFAATGVKASSSAAVIQSIIGNVGANSLFAVFQSAGAAGSGLAVVNAVVQVGGAVTVVFSGGLAWVKSML